MPISFKGVGWIGCVVLVCCYVGCVAPIGGAERDVKMSVVAYVSKATLKEAEELLAEKFPFNAGSLTAKMEYIDLGEPSPLYAYVVRSYGVAIAIHASDSLSHAYFKHIRFDAYDHSQTTSKHANIVKRAWSLDN